ncbi:Hypothetical predicted protein [Paramuricea clavata]|uniref:Uncharacterized protein n=1 Tax=Paramuricea clavata TaxID=317549 RepID=A0A6S7ID70_PARCT|nr:Hypothetical predicted protein [Paramuricea clavata]
MPCGQDDVNQCLEYVSHFAKGTNSLIVLDDCASSQSVKNRTSELVKLGFSARHIGISTIVITQQLTSTAKPYRENISKLVTFYNPSAKDTDIILNNYLANTEKEERKEIINTLKNKNNDYARNGNHIRIVEPETPVASDLREKLLKLVDADYERQRLENTNNQLADVIITKFSELMQAVDAVKDAEGMKKELEENDLLRKDIKNLVSYVTPYIPLIGLLSGGITVGKHVISTKAGCSEKEE